VCGAFRTSVFERCRRFFIYFLRFHFDFEFALASVGAFTKYVYGRKRGGGGAKLGLCRALTCRAASASAASLAACLAAAWASAAAKCATSCAAAWRARRGGKGGDRASRGAKAARVPVSEHCPPIVRAWLVLGERRAAK
jgi:hypothetical protein